MQKPHWRHEESHMPGRGHGGPPFRALAKDVSVQRLAVCCWGLGLSSLACLSTAFAYVAAIPGCPAQGAEDGAVQAFRLAPLGAECLVLGEASATGWSGSWVMTWLFVAGCAGVLATLGVRAVLEARLAMAHLGNSICQPMDPK